MTHDENYHADVHRCYQRIFDAFYISKLSRKLRIYINHCSSYQINQIKRHQSYEKLVFISIPPHFFHIIIMNFIIDLFGKYDCFLILTNKFIRRIQFILKYITDFVAV